jgi:transglutaminase-like putative cysteine protease
MSAVIAPFESGRSMERVRLDWALIAIAVMAAPHALHLAPWITIATALLGLYRLLAQRRHWKLPGRYTRYVLAFMAFGGVLANFHTLNGAEAGTSLLLLLSMLKLMEAKSLRDYFLLVVIAYFLGIANFLYDQTIQLALYMLPALWVATMAMLNVAHPDPERRLGTAFRSVTRFLLPAIPMAAVMFLLFPRLSGPLWGFGSQKHAGITGLSSNMAPGDLSQLAESDAIAFHVKFDGVAPPRNEMYWRALVLHEYDGKTWSSGNLPWHGDASAVLSGTPVHYQVTLEANDLQVLYTLDLPSKLPEDTYLSASYETDTRGTVTERKLYEVTSYPRSPHYGVDTPGWMLRRDLALPKRGDPRTRALAQGWRDSKKSPGQIVNAALDMFHDQPFHYTLQPGALTSADRMDEFLFQSRRGFCEHYAGAFVYLMRAAGIPAHVVIGYQGGTQNPLDEYYVIRQQEAHAWAEVWTPGRGWSRVDPTGAVDPARVEEGLDGALPNEDLAGSIYQRYPWLGAVRNGWDALDSGWDKWVLAYGPDLQAKFFSKVGLDYGDWLQLAFVMGGLVALLMGLYWLYLIWDRRPPRLPPVSRDYARFCLRLARLGLPRAGHEGPMDYAMRVVSARSDLEREVLDITDRYVELRYQDSGDDAGFRRSVKAFRPKRKPAPNLT